MLKAQSASRSTRRISASADSFLQDLSVIQPDSFAQDLELEHRIEAPQALLELKQAGLGIGNTSISCKFADLEIAFQRQRVYPQLLHPSPALCFIHRGLDTETQGKFGLCWDPSRTLEYSNPQRQPASVASEVINPSSAIARKIEVDMFFIVAYGTTSYRPNQLGINACGVVARGLNRVLERTSQFGLDEGQHKEGWAERVKEGEGGSWTKRSERDGSRVLRVRGKKGGENFKGTKGKVWKGEEVMRGKSGMSIPSIFLFSTNAHPWDCRLAVPGDSNHHGDQN
ncbi:hypothetical protein C8R46DRAFT_1029162 [Mycena filopes]|nr:hypothetical protein C8R46DRAFT_1029162 [Mycena filopes]